MKRKIQFLIGGAVIAAILIGILYQGMQSTVYFYTPAEILAAPSEFQGKTIRIGALVQKGSTEWDSETVRLKFSITEDSKQFIPIVFEGVKPDLYREGQGVVVEGRLDGGGIFHANELLVKHSEEYTVDEGGRMEKGEMFQSLETQ